MKLTDAQAWVLRKMREGEVLTYHTPVMRFPSRVRLGSAKMRDDTIAKLQRAGYINRPGVDWGKVSVDYTLTPAGLEALTAWEEKWK